MNMWLENQKERGDTPIHHNRCLPRQRQGQNRAKTGYQPTGRRAPHDEPKRG